MNTSDVKASYVTPVEHWFINQGSNTPNDSVGGPNGSVVLGNYFFHFYVTNVNFDTSKTGQVMCQKGLINGSDTDKDDPWTVYSLNDPFPVQYQTNAGIGNITSFGPPSAVVIDGIIHLFYSESPNSTADGNQYRIWHSRFKYDPNSETHYVEAPRVVFENEEVMYTCGPTISYNPLTTSEYNVMLLWPGEGKNGFFFCLGKKITTNDLYGVDIAFAHSDSDRQKGLCGKVPQTDRGEDGARYTWPHMNGLAPYAMNGLAGFVLITPYSNDNQFKYAYTIYDLNKQEFADVRDFTPGLEETSYISMTSLQPSAKNIAPFAVDDKGNMAAFIVSYDNNKLQGVFWDWVHCSIGGPDAMTALETNINIGIPPSISLSNSIDPPNTSAIFSPVVRSSENNGGALIAMNYEDSRIATVAVCIHFDDNES